MRIVHLSDVHVWQFTFNPFHLLNKRAVGVEWQFTTADARVKLRRLYPVVQ